MNSIPDVMHFCLRSTHIVFGALSLLLFWLILFLQKGTSRHQMLGSGFVVCSIGAGGTALISAGWALLHLETFVPEILEMPKHLADNLREGHRFVYSIMLFLAVATLSGALYGFYSVRFRGDVVGLRRTVVPALQAASFITGFGLMVFGGSHVVFGIAMDRQVFSAYWAPLLIGTIGCVASAKQLGQLWRPLKDSREWLYRHVEHMSGTGTALHAAFVVFGARTWLTPHLKGYVVFLPALIPVIVGGVATKWYIARLKRRSVSPVFLGPADTGRRPL